jgi:hypothetical protein
MKKYSQIHKVISVLMIFILLIQFSGCYANKEITVSGLPNPVDYHYIMYYKDANYLLDDVEISNEVITGKIDAGYFNKSTSLKGKKVSLFLSSDTAIQILPETIVNIPYTSIEKVKLSKPSGERTFGLILLLLAIPVAIALVDLAINGFDIDILGSK